jgi:hypothetical protein
MNYVTSQGVDGHAESAECGCSLHSDLLDITRDKEGADVSEDTQHQSGNLKRHLSYWRRISRSTWVLQWIEYGFPLWWLDPNCPAPARVFNNHSSTVDHEGFVSEAVEQLVKAGAARATKVKPTVVNALKVVPKKNNKLRLILDLRWVNKYLRVPKFKFESLKCLAFLITQGELMFGIDLTNGYWQVDMHDMAHPYLGFEWKGQYYYFTVLPFGLASAPWAFAMIMRQFAGHLRWKGVKLINYLDDYIFCCGTNREVARAQQKMIMREVADAGLHVNVEKSQMELGTTATCLGFVIDSITMSFTVPKERWDNFVSALRAIAKSQRASARAVAKVTGHLVSMSLVLGGLARLFTKYCYRFIDSASSWDMVSSLPHSVQDELQFWMNMEREELTGSICPTPAVAGVIIHTDASGTGWAGTMGSAVAKGDFSVEERQASSTYREMTAIFAVLLSFSAHLKCANIHLFTDNMGCSAIVDHGSNKEHLQAIARDVFSIVKQLKSVLHVAWIPRDSNQVADLWSKITDGDDWRLNPTQYCKLERLWGPHTVDRFASHLNNVTTRFNSKFFCPGAEAVDCFSQTWVHDNNWCYPPVSAVGKLLHFLHSMPAVATIVLPVAPTAVWWPVLCYGEGVFASFVVGCVVMDSSPQLHVMGPGVTSSDFLNTAFVAIRVDFNKGWRLRRHLPFPLL